MPAATPLPGRPAALVLGSAEVLLDRDGCAICSYTAEASGWYLSWFALEAHADPATFNLLCASLGMCPRHTRALIRQPGAARRLTPVYWHIMRTVPARFGAREPRLAPCPACEHDQAATHRAAGIVADCLADDAQGNAAGSALSRLCLPHARVIAAVAGPRGSRLLPQANAEPATAGPAGIDELAGGPDHDAGNRAWLRGILPSPGDPPEWTCRICLTGVLAELTSLTTTAGIRGAGPAGGATGAYLCPHHLRDAVAMHPESAPQLLAGQHVLQNEELRRLTARQRLRGHRRLGKRASRHRPGSCPACQGCDRAMQTELERHRTLLSGKVPDPADAQGLCVHHVLSMHATAPQAGRLAAVHATERAMSLTAELADAFGKNTWMRRHEPKGAETTAWLRAAVFLNGRIFGGAAPPEPPGRCAEPEVRLW